jgi:predicted  nucleic acid-binding Zn-ribbon protein
MSPARRRASASVEAARLALESAIEDEQRTSDYLKELLGQVSQNDASSSAFKKQIDALSKQVSLKKTSKSDKARMSTVLEGVQQEYEQLLVDKRNLQNRLDKVWLVGFLVIDTRF